MKIDLNFIKDEKIGKAEVNTFEITEREHFYSKLRAQLNNKPEQIIEPGTYKRLFVNGELVMSNTNMEVDTHLKAISKAKGNVLVSGLGLGLYLTAVKDMEEVKSITVIEKSKDVIELIGKYYKNDKIKIINDDIFKYETDEHFDLIWLDIWRDFNEDNLKEMELLRNKFSKNSNEILCWSEDILLERKIRNFVNME